MKKMGKYRFIFYSALTLLLFWMGHLLRTELSFNFMENGSLWRDPVLGGMICGVGAGILGVYILLNRVVFVTLALAQGAGLGIFILFWICALLGYHLDHATLPFVTGLGFAALFALAFAWLRHYKTFSEESLIGLLYVISAGLILILGDRISQGRHSMDNLLFGNAVAVTSADLKLIVSVVTAITLSHLKFRRQFLYASADPVFMHTMGMKVRLWMLVLFALITVGVTVSLKTLGTLPVFALMVIPPFIALKRAKSLPEAFSISVLIGVFLPALGYYYSFLFGFPTGASLIFVTLFYLAAAWVEGAVLRPTKKNPRKN